MVVVLVEVQVETCTGLIDSTGTEIFSYACRNLAISYVWYELAKLTLSCSKGSHAATLLSNSPRKVSFSFYVMRRPRTYIGEQK